MLTSDQLRAARALLGWSQVELAKRAQVSAATVRAWEQRPHTPLRASSQLLWRLATVLLEAGVGYGVDSDRVFVSLRNPFSAEHGTKVS